SSHPAYNRSLCLPSIGKVLEISEMERYGHKKRKNGRVNPEKVVIPVLYKIQRFAITNRGRIRTLNKRHPPLIVRASIEHAEAIDRGVKTIDATQDLKMRNIGRSKHRQLRKMNAKMAKNIHKKLRQRDLIVGKIKKSSVYTNLASETL
ncbi:hypothetical protein Tco_1416222, partial [Tanacetum coccineum]